MGNCNSLAELESYLINFIINVSNFLSSMNAGKLEGQLLLLEGSMGLLSAEVVTFPEQYGLSFRSLPGDCHYRHIATNLVEAVRLNVESAREGKVLQEPSGELEGFVLVAERSMHELQIYFQLLKDFDSYREAGDYYKSNGLFI